MWNFARLLEHVAYSHPALCLDSRKATSGCVFVAVSGATADGGLFIRDAVARKAAFVVCEERHVDTVPADVVAVAVASPRLAVAQLAAARYGTSTLPFKLVGVTGTNGKTTVTYLLEHLFAQAGLRTGVLGTVAYRWPGHNTPASMTTPDPLDLHAMLADMAAANVQMAAMEVSSHALDQNRVAELPFSGAVFTNLTQDHLDYHKTFDSYFAAKARLFLEQPLANKVMAVGVDDLWGKRLAATIMENLAGSAPQLLTYGLNKHSAGKRHVYGEIVESSTRGLTMNVHCDGKVWVCRSPLVGAFNAQNLLAVQALATGMGIDHQTFDCFTDFYGVPGRLERIPNKQGLDVFVDYAHTPDALTNVLSALRGAGFKRIICLFGCGGDRDRTKRPLMGDAVAQGADVAVLTSDNPRHEAPEAIMADVLPGLATAAAVLTEPDRRKAIERALDWMQPGDALLVAGKGHETTQQVGDVKHPFSDQQTIREILHASQL